VNPISSERTVMRRRLLASLMEVVERNARVRDRQALFEVGPVFWPREDDLLPEEPSHLALVLSGPRAERGWQPADRSPMDFYDLKGVVEAMLDGLHLTDAHFEPTTHPTFHPGKCARVLLGDQEIGVMGELHPLLRDHYDLPDAPVLAAEFDWDAMQAHIPELYALEPVPAFPPVLEDLAVVVDEAVSAAEVARVIRKAGGKMLAAVRLFDLYQGDQIGAGKKSLAYRLTYQAPDRTLTDKEAAKIRQRIIRALERELGAVLRG